MNLGEKKESSESTPSYEEVAIVESINRSVDIVRLEVTQNDNDKITTTICEEQAKADIYLAHNTDDGSEKKYKITTTICEEQAKADIYLIHDINDGGKKKYKCPACEQCCTKRSNVRRHIKRLHGGRSELIKQVSPDYAISCLLCEQKFSHIVYLKPHLTQFHGVQFDEQEYFFQSSDEFLEWKTALEKRTDSVYIKQTGEVKRKDGLSYSYFKCNRSGNYKPKLSANQRKRKLKPYGTVKMNSHCTSVMKLIHGVNGGINVNFCATHYGHDGFKECREAMLENERCLTNKRNRKIIRLEDSKMIGAFVNHATKELSGGDGNSPLSNEPIVSIILEAEDCKTDFMIDKTFTSQQMAINDSGMKPDCYQQNEAIMVNENMSTDNACTSPNSSEGSDDHTTYHLPSEDVGLTPKQKLVSNLRKLVNVIENCESDEILDFVANGVDELVNRFTPLLENHHTEENVNMLFESS